MTWLALDIGGANLKMADGKGFAINYAFAPWKDSQQLARALRTLLAEAPPSDHLAVTMTGELADCFENKEEGVRFIVEAIQAAADNRHTRVFLRNGTLVAPQVASMRPEDAAASNWRALGEFAARYAPSGGGLVLDIGSTTVDVLPVRDGRLCNAAADDTSRLMAHELVYTGVERTPLCALLKDAPYRGGRCPVAAELFATTLDAYVLTNEVSESTTRFHTADGRGATKANARTRIGRMIGAPSDFNHRDAVAIAQAAVDAQVELVAEAIRAVLERIPEDLSRVVVSGHGDYLALKVLKLLGLRCEVLLLSSVIGRLAARCAPAHALAMLASEGPRA